MELEETNTSNNNNSNNNNNSGMSERPFGGVAGGIPSDGRLRGWNHPQGHSSRIIRVSRATGGKDRHSKVMTSKGPRDRRVRLSVSTAIQFYDLQDRLGFDQPSKAVEWLIRAASDAIAELPSLNAPFPDEKMASNDDRHVLIDSAEADPNDLNQNRNQNQNMSASKSTCSSTSDTSKNSGLSLSRSENRVKARERARERVVAKEKESNNQNDGIDNDGIAHCKDMNNNSMAQTSSFTELLTAGVTSGSLRPNNPTGSVNPNRQWTGPPPVEYFPNQVQLLGNSLIIPPPPFGLSGDQDHHQETLQPFSIIPDHHHHHHHHQNHHLISAVGPGGGSYNLDFNISSPGSLAGFNRGTLQSNCQSLFNNHLFQRISSSSSPFFVGSQATENHHHQHQQNFPAAIDGRLQLYYDNNGSRNSDQKGAGKR